MIIDISIIFILFIYLFFVRMILLSSLSVLMLSLLFTLLYLFLVIISISSSQHNLSLSFHYSQLLYSIVISAIFSQFNTVLWLHLASVTWLEIGEQSFFCFVLFFPHLLKIVVIFFFFSGREYCNMKTSWISSLANALMYRTWKNVIMLLIEKVVVSWVSKCCWYWRNIFIVTYYWIFSFIIRFTIMMWYSLTQKNIQGKIILFHFERS